MVKRYYTTDTLNNILRPEFVNSTNEKHIFVIGCKFFVNDELLDDNIEGFQDHKFITLRVDIIYDRCDLDSFVCYVMRHYPSARSTNNYMTSECFIYGFMMLTAQK